MSYRWVEHTAELQLEIEAEDEAGVFADALHAVGELLSDGGSGEEVVRRLDLSAADRGALLVSWLDELVYLAETEDLVPQTVRKMELSARYLSAAVAFTRSAPRHLIKGATYHGLAFEPTAGGYRATVVLDV